MKRVLLLLLLSLSVAACTTVTDFKDEMGEKIFGRDVAEPPADLADIKPTVGASVLWQANIGKGATYDFSPAVDGEAVFAASADGELARLDASSGKEAWRIVAEEQFSGGVGAGAHLVLVGTLKGWVFAFDQSNGKEVWKSKVSSEVLSVPKISGDVVVVRCGDSRVFGLNVSDGKRKWVYERATPALTLRSSAGVSIAGGVAYIGFAGGKMIALAADDGRVLWETSVAQPRGTTEIERIADITSLPIAEGDFVYAAAYQGRLVGVERGSGRVLWNRDISSYTGLGIDGTHLYLSHAKGAVYAFDYASGKTYWRQGALENRQLSAPLPVKQYVAVGDLEGYVHFLNREDGAFAARVSTDGSAVMAQPVALGDSSVLVQTRGGGLYAISLK